MTPGDPIAGSAIIRRMRRRLDGEAVARLRRLHDEFLTELQTKGYAPNAIDTYDKHVERVAAPV